MHSTLFSTALIALATCAIATPAPHQMDIAQMQQEAPSNRPPSMPGQPLENAPHGEDYFPNQEEMDDDAEDYEAEDVNVAQPLRYCLKA